MAAGYGIFPRASFHDAEIRSLSDKGFRIWTYLLTGPHTNIIGCFQCPEGYIASDLDWPIETVREPFAELLQIGLAKRLSEGRHVLIPQFHKINTIANPNVFKAALKQLAELPLDPEISAIFDWLEPYAKRFKKGLPEQLETLRKRYRQSFRNTEAEAEAEIAIENTIEIPGKEVVLDLETAAGNKFRQFVQDIGGDPQFRIWFGGASIIEGEPRRLTVSEARKRDHIAREFRHSVNRAFGSNTEIVVREIGVAA